MQLEKNIVSYKRKSTINIKKEGIIILTLLIASALMSRVVIYFSANNIIGIAPFGISFLFSIIINKNRAYILASYVGVNIGYLSVINKISDKYSLIISITVITVYSMISLSLKKTISMKINFILVIISCIVSGFFINNYDIGINITIACINVVMIFPIYSIVKYGSMCIKNFSTNYFFSTEDFLSIVIILCVIVSGIGSNVIFGINLRNIVAYFIVLAVACIGGTAYGATMGLCMGLIVGISSENITFGIVFFGIIGLVSGIFKQTGKVYVIIAYAITFCIISLYFQNLSIYTLIECVIGGILVLFIPSRIYKVIECELDIYKKRDRINNLELDEVKLNFINRINGFSNSLQIVSNALNEIDQSSQLSYKTESAALIENLTDRVCSKCTRSKTCWERDFNSTYNAFEKLIKSCEENRIVFPHQLEKVCFEKFQLIKGADSLVTSLKSNQIFKSRLQDGRLIASKHIFEVSNTVQMMAERFKRDIKIDSDLERILRKALNKNKIYPQKVFCYIDENGRTKIKLSFQNCQGSNYCIKNVLPAMNKIMNMKMEICNEGCKIKVSDDECYIVFSEAPKFKAISYAAVCKKNMEKISGDSYGFEKSYDGMYINMISDGMGSGPKASKDSMTTIKIMESLLESGFDSKIAISITNDVMNMRFSEEESFSTLDLNLIDLYTGKCEFIKMGAACSFVKRGKCIKEFMSEMPPMGTIDELDIESSKFQIKNGDLIIMVSDGVLETNKNNKGDINWLRYYLEDSIKEPKALAQDILDKAKELNQNIICDDMTVLVCKVQSENFMISKKV